uniref:tumor necrosis factor-inducible gene 6 protein-like isoform X2 n=1 Tax=Myxine glutinosa TaxID=7769 RepID=UPI00359028D5
MGNFYWYRRLHSVHVRWRSAPLPAMSRSAPLLLLAGALLTVCGMCHCWSYKGNVWHNSIWLEHASGVFHMQSRHGRYKLDYKSARAVCKYEEARIATLKELRKAQKIGLHQCVAGWLAGRRVAYPVIKPSKNCGFGKVGLVNYGIRLNRSELWDTYCYRKEDLQCGGKYREQQRTFTSPDYPGYRNGQTCQWFIHVPIKKRIRLTFKDFNLEPDPYCESDYVEVHDSYDDTFGFLGRFCSDEKPPNIISTGNVLTVTFHSDASRTARGFIAHYKAVNSTLVND